MAGAWALGLWASARPAGQECPGPQRLHGEGYWAGSPCRHDSPVSAHPLLCHSGCGRLIVKVRGGRPSKHPLMARGLHAGAIWGIDFFLGYKLQMETSCQAKGSPGVWGPGGPGATSRVERLLNALCTPDTVRPGQRGERRRERNPSQEQPAFGSAQGAMASIWGPNQCRALMRRPSQAVEERAELLI